MIGLVLAIFSAAVLMTASIQPLPASPWGSPQAPVAATAKPGLVVPAGAAFLQAGQTAPCEGVRRTLRPPHGPTVSELQWQVTNTTSTYFPAGSTLRVSEANLTSPAVFTLNSGLAPNAQVFRKATDTNGSWATCTATLSTP